MLDNGEITAGLVIPAGTVDNIMTGKNTPIDIIFPKDSGFEAAILVELTSSISSMLASAQAGVYAGIDFYNANNKQQEKQSMITSLNIKNMTTVLNRESVFKEEYISATGNISTANYYTTGGIVMFLLLFSINIAAIYRAYSKHVEYKLLTSDVGILKQIICKYMSILTLYVLLLPVIIIFLFVILTPKSVFALIIPLIICILCTSAIALLVYELFRNNINCILFSFMLSVIFAFISGCLIPSLMLPEIINDISLFIPSTYIVKVLNNTFTGTFSILPYIVLLAFTFILGMLTYIVKKVKLRFNH